MAAEKSVEVGSDLVALALLQVMALCASGLMGSKLVVVKEGAGVSLGDSLSKE